MLKGKYQCHTTNKNTHLLTAQKHPPKTRATVTQKSILPENEGLGKQN